VESTGKRVRGRQFELLLLLLFIYVGAAFRIGRGKCEAGPVRGMAEEGEGSRPRPEKGRQSW